MKFGLFGSAQAQRGGPDLDSGQGFKDYIEYNVEAEALGYSSTFVVEHHFTGFGQVSASLGQGTSTETNKGLASALYFSAYFTAGALAGYLPGLAWEGFGWTGVAVTAIGTYGLGLCAVVGGALLVRRLARYR